MVREEKVTSSRVAITFKRISPMKIKRKKIQVVVTNKTAAAVELKFTTKLLTVRL